ncbi:MAG: hypothetical protein J5833_02350 [Victivallales bacterium]|nr:hypothetical protein [Victivallales bacterium]
MRDFEPDAEKAFFDLFTRFFDSEKDAGKQHDPANYSLDRMFPLAELAGNPEQRLKIIHVAGTKGKGTTSHFISALLGSCGKRVGLFTSPHLCTVRERFQIDNALAPYELLTAEAADFVAAVEKAALTPSLFEIFTLLAMKLFVKCGVEYAVMETGIGGRLDATNFVRNPLVTVITPISFDHVALLGSTIEAIASEKAGIIKPNVPLVLSRQPYAAAVDVVKRRAAELSAPVFAPADISEAYAFLPQDCPQFLRENFTSSLKAVRLLGMEPLPEDFTMPQLRARFECIHENPIVVLDGAHNADSMQKLVSAINEKYAGTHWNVVLGAVKGKDVHGMAQALKNLDADFILTNPHTGKGSALPLLIEEANAAGLYIYKVIENLNDRSQLPLDKPLLFTGSFFTALIGEELFGK